MSVTVYGAGAFGTALAISLAREHNVTLMGRDLRDMVRTRQNTARLPGYPFPDPLRLAEGDPGAVDSETVLLSVPMQMLRGVIAPHANALAGRKLVACCKGVELTSGLGPVSVIREAVPEGIPAILTGPSFAADIARGLPTALTLACMDPVAGSEMQRQLTTRNLRLYRTKDVIGAELGGALKNVIAIACGAAMGAGLGESARAALMTRGFAEMQRLAAWRGAEPDTLAGLSGFGDLTLTCTSEQSRNYRLGQSIGCGTAFDASTTVEGAATARAVHDIAQDADLDMPITLTVAALLDEKLDVQSAMEKLLTRPLKEE